MALQPQVHCPQAGLATKQQLESDSASGPASVTVLAIIIMAAALTDSLPAHAVTVTQAFTGSSSQSSSRSGIRIRVWGGSVTLLQRHKLAWALTAKWRWSLSGAGPLKPPPQHRPALALSLAVTVMAALPLVAAACVTVTRCQSGRDSGATAGQTGGIKPDS